MAPTLQSRTEPSQEDRLGEGTKSQEGATGSYSSYPIKLGAIGFVLGGVGWIAVDLVSSRLASALPPTPLQIKLSIGLYMGTILLSVVGLVGLHALQRGSYGGVGRAGFYTILASSATIVVTGMVHLFGSAALDWLANPVGVLGIIVGFSLYGAATVQAGVMPRWYGVVLIVFLPFSVLLGPYANMWMGVVLLVLGFMLWMLWTSGDLPAEQYPSRGLRNI